MAARGAAASLQLTTGVALATLVVMGAILAGPAVIACSNADGGLGACLRDRLDMGPADPGAAPELLPPLPLPDPRVPAPRAVGWMEASATEYAPRDAASATLTGAPGRLQAGGARPSSAAIASVDFGNEPHGDLVSNGAATPTATDTIEVALAAPAGAVFSSGGTSTHPAAASAVLLASPGGISAEGGVTGALPAPVDVALAPAPGTMGGAGLGSAASGIPGGRAVELAPAPGRLTGTGRAPAGGPSIAAVALSPPAGEITGSGSGPAAAPSVIEVALAPAPGQMTASFAELGVNQLAPEVALSPRPIEGPRGGDPLATGSIASASEAPASASLAPGLLPALPTEPDAAAPPMPEPIVRFNPSFPDVLVLPPPATGEDSSIVILELR